MAAGSIGSCGGYWSPIVAAGPSRPYLACRDAADRRAGPVRVPRECYVFEKVLRVIRNLCGAAAGSCR